MAKSHTIELAQRLEDAETNTQPYHSYSHLYTHTLLFGLLKRIFAA